VTAPFFLVDSLAPEAGGVEGGTVVLEGPDGRHAVSVRRIAVGEHVLLGDGAGRVVEAVATAWWHRWSR